MSAGCKSTRPASVLPAVRILTTVCVMSVFAMSVLIDLTWAEVVFLTSKARDNPPSLFIALLRMLGRGANVRGSTFFFARSLLCCDGDTYCCTSLSTSIHTLDLSFVAILHRSDEGKWNANEIFFSRFWNHFNNPRVHETFTRNPIGLFYCSSFFQKLWSWVQNWVQVLVWGK